MGALPLLIALTACLGPKDGDPDTGGAGADVDADGDVSSEACNDADSAVHPGNPEVCDGIDNECNGAVDEGVSSTW
jgi:hypothetical protein